MVTLARFGDMHLAGLFDPDPRNFDEIYKKFDVEIWNQMREMCGDDPSEWRNNDEIIRKFVR